MRKQELMGHVDRIIEMAKTAMLVGIDAQGHPFGRWMTPTLIKDRPFSLFSVSAADSAKVKHLETHPHVEWVLQSPCLREVIHLRGRLNIVDHASLCSEVMECISPRLTVFWKVNVETTRFVVLETVLDEGVYYLPMKDTRQAVSFQKGES